MARTRAEIAWAAGFWEGEGSVAVWGRKRPDGTRYRYLHITASQKDPEPLKRLARMYGNKVGQPNGPGMHKWGLTGVRAEQFVADIWPWLSMRRKEQIAAKRGQL